MDREPQLPLERCRLPSVARSGRGLRSHNTALFEKAKVACGKHGADIDLCIDDVMLAGDLEMAEAW